ncbi:MAG: prolipoprotein diacylglyceryl transferase [Sandaracinus sp.]|nr:prolipoprotein diacylglyceryl transferase [Sandaracinus sp.]MCB9635758.1 prolipoprotein diacylglyceryl transferase [Sandaracinus sp.]
MDPVLTVLHFGGTERTLGTFGLLVGLGILVSSLLGTRAAARAGLDPGLTIASFGFTAAGSIAGAYGLFVVVELFRTGHLLDFANEGGLVFYGAPIGGGLALYLSCRGFGLPFLRLCDAAVHAIPAGHAIGRLGCFFGGCCFGSEIPATHDAPFWAVRYTNLLAPAAHPPVLRHPTPLYESALLLLVAWALTTIPTRRVGDGSRLGLYCVIYAAVRTTVELYRGDLVRGVWALGLSTSQWLSLLTAGLGFVLLARARHVFPRGATA